MAIIKFSTSSTGGSSIPTVSSWSGLSALEPATPGIQRIITGGVSGAVNTGDALALRGTSNWYIPSGDATALSYVEGHPIPAPVINPLRSHAYISAGGAFLDTANNASATSYALTFKVQNFPTSINWTQVRLWGLDSMSGTGAAPTNIWFALADGGSQQSPTLVGGAVTWVAATGVTAPPTGTDDVPGIGPICSYVSISKTTSSQWIAVRIQLASGDYNRMSIATDPTYIIDGFDLPKSQGSITGNPGTTSGWGEAFGQFPAIILEYNNLSTPVYMLGCMGDSHLQGYIGSGISGFKGFFGEIDSIWSAGTYPKVALCNLGRSGHTMEQISGRLHAFEAAMDFGGWIRQRASVNNRNGSLDITTTIANTMYATLQSDYSYLFGRNKLMLPWAGPGMNGAASGWYPRFRAHVSDEVALWPGHMLDNIQGLITNASDGTYLGSYAGGDGGHPNESGYAAGAAVIAPALLSVLSGLGYSP